jgi:hypothetical protein
MNQVIRKKISNFFDVQEKPKVRFKVVNAKHICVNDINVIEKNGKWNVDQYNFWFKKSAIAYAVYLVNEDTKSATALKSVDSKLNKLLEDIVMYKRPTENKEKRFIRQSRLSAVLPNYYQQKDMLNTLVQSVNIT